MKFLSKKDQNEIIKRVAANELIFSHMSAKTDIPDWEECVEHFVDNTVEIAGLVADLEGVYMVQEILNKKRKREQNNG